MQLGLPRAVLLLLGFVGGRRLFKEMVIVEGTCEERRGEEKRGEERRREERRGEERRVMILLGYIPYVST